MVCPPEIAGADLAILQYGILRIRILGWEGRADRCATEADHIHNLPNLLTDYAERKLAYHWTFERNLFIKRTGQDNLGAWADFSEELRPHAEAVCPPQESGFAETAHYP